jgi:MoaA/NifB/PqqE/SkfB family radical SAM enzyme
VPHHRRRALLREDFSDLYRTLKGKGLVVSLFTNGCC